MNQIIKLAIIGGTGKSGKYLVQQLLNQGFQFKMLLRNPDNFHITSPQIEIVQGDARNPEAVFNLLKDCQAVISTIGQPIGESSIFGDASRNVLQAMEQLGINRYILLTGLNVDTPFDKKSPKTKFGTDWMKENYPKTTLDKQLEYEMLVKSKIDWTLVRLPLIEQTTERRQVNTSLEDCIGDKISATDLADFLIKQLSDITFIRKAPFIFEV
ncbi:NAD(P)-dependent oxidoreductase [Arcicella lustrica]|uniref:NAD(P)H-binding protein n=1 Tax=Arcicella lustrica TaxID=2984196 RepID=A0ABU5SDG8_9BACT|nr:NAD(P)H-binding protein [Arcicella sp. DC25W]MEA5425286.1 NAD(P)H-binding protein [Arcicella sp. DC25W]